MTQWGGAIFCCWLGSFYFCELGSHAKFWNPATTPAGVLNNSVKKRKNSGLPKFAPMVASTLLGKN